MTKVSASELFKVYNWGDPTVLQRTNLGKRRSQLQDFQQLKSQLSSSGTNFVDPNFSHDGSSIGEITELFDVAKSATFYQDQIKDGWDKVIRWVRIEDYMKSGTCSEGASVTHIRNASPVFGCGKSNETFSRMDINQGMVGDCWFLAALGAVALRQDIMDSCVPTDNVYNNEGIYHFKFWYQGCFVDVVVDDYLPCMKYTGAGLPYYRVLGTNPTKTGTSIEFWVTLLEKAYAKLHGNYCNISGNSPAVAFENITGGFPEVFLLGAQTPPDLPRVIQNNLNQNTVLALSCQAPSQGLIGGHAYSITGYKKVHLGGIYGGQAVELIRVRNPHGSGEWTGPFNDNDVNWELVEEDVSKDRVKREDGEFWMPYYEMVEKFYCLSSICLLKETDFPNTKLDYFGWFGEWSRANNTAGGTNTNSLPNNPQYVVTVAGSGQQPLALALTSQGDISDKNAVSASFYVFRIPDIVTKDPPFTFNEMFMDYGDGKAVGVDQRSDIYGGFGSSNGLLSCAGYKVEAGRYLVMPVLTRAGVERKFCLRVLTTTN